MMNDLRYLILSFLQRFKYTTSHLLGDFNFNIHQLNIRMNSQL